MKLRGCIIFIVVIVAAAIFALAIISHYNNAISESNKTGEIASITISSGESPNSVKDTLISNNIIKDQDVFFGFSAYKLYEYFTKFDTKIQAGSYSIEKGSSIKDVAEILQKADVDQAKVTIREGLRLEEMADEFNRVLNDGINKKSKYNKNDFINLAKNYDTGTKEYLSSRPIGNRSLEGYLFPDTYFLSKDVSAQSVINTMLDNFNNKIYQPYLGTIKINKYNLHQLLTVSSIVQREVQTPEDMAMVSSIFFRRIELNLPLGSDVTVLYALGYSQSEGVWWRKAEPTQQDLLINSPYNTRKFTGLPPGPIDSPGLASFLATLNPKSTNYLYFLTDKEGITRYAKTAAEHEANIKKYLS